MKKYLLTAFFFLSSVFAADRESVLKIVEKVNEVKRALSSESAQWLEEKKSLELELQLVKDALLNGENSQKDISKRVADLRKRKEELAESSKKVKDELKAINVKMDAILKALISFSASVPQPLKVHISKELESVQQSLSSEDPLFKLNSINSITQAILTLQKNTHRVRQIIELDSKEVQVEVLYIGTSNGYFLAKSQQKAGSLVNKGGQWEIKIDDQLYDKIDKAFKAMDREGRPELVKLPVELK